MGQKRRHYYPYRLEQGGVNPKSYRDLLAQMERIRRWMKRRYTAEAYLAKLPKLYRAFRKCKAIRGIDPVGMGNYCRGWQKMYITPLGYTALTEVRGITVTDIKRRYASLYRMEEIDFTATALRALAELVRANEVKKPIINITDNKE